MFRYKKQDAVGGEHVSDDRNVATKTEHENHFTDARKKPYVTPLWRVRGDIESWPVYTGIAQASAL